MSLTESTWLRLGRSMSDCLAVTIEILEAGVRHREFDLDDPARTVNYLYAQTVGLLHLARLGVGVSHSPEGTPTLFAVTATEVQEMCVQTALAAIGR